MANTPDGGGRSGDSGTTYNRKWMNFLLQQTPREPSYILGILKLEFDRVSYRKRSKGYLGWQPTSPIQSLTTEERASN